MIEFTATTRFVMEVEDYLMLAPGCGFGGANLLGAWGLCVQDKGLGGVGHSSSFILTTNRWLSVLKIE
jgi:hypothetical protein